MNREFFTARTVGEALAGFRPARRTAVETVALAEALHRVPADRRRARRRRCPASPARPWTATRSAPPTPTAPPRACPPTSTWPERCGWAPRPRSPCRTGKCVAIPTGAVLPDGADAVVMVEYTAETMPGTIEVTRPVAPGAGLVRADEDVAAGDVLVRAGQAAARPAARAPGRGRRHHGGRARPPAGRDRLHRRRGGAAGDRDARGRAGARRDRVRAGRAGPGRRRGAGPGRDRPGRPGRAGGHAARRARPTPTWWSSRPDPRSAPATRPPGRSPRSATIWCHGLAVKPGKPTLLAECAGVPLLGLPGNPLSALVVFRLVGVPLVWRLAGCERRRRSRPCAPG